MRDLWLTCLLTGTETRSSHWGYPSGLPKKIVKMICRQTHRLTKHLSTCARALNSNFSVLDYFRAVYGMSNEIFWVLVHWGSISKRLRTSQLVAVTTSTCCTCVRAPKLRALRHSLCIVQELCESRGGRPGLSVLTSLLVSVDVKNYWTVLRHWSQLVPNMSNDIWGH